ncbi:MAG: ABC transporter permease [Halanaerobiales bacterium]|nr:ABC transporter permease [Halanaerobiales bacterium]
MTNYIIKRLLQMIPVVIGVSLIVFSLMHLTPGDPVQIMLGEYAQQSEIDQVRDVLGLNDPIYVQYFRFIGGAIHGDFGDSLYFRKPVMELISARLGYTLTLSVVGMIISYLIAFPVGIISAVKQNTWVDDLGMVGALLGVSMPNFWLGMMLILLFSLKLGWLPASGVGTWKHLILPAVTVGTSGAALTTRLVRSSMLEVIRKDFVRTARAKGLSEKVVIYKHALRNALIPVITIIGLRLGFILGGAVITETIFGRPGVGRLMVDSIFRRDYLVVQGVTLIIAFSILMANLVIDLTYSFIDPRIRYD